MVDAVREADLGPGEERLRGADPGLELRSAGVARPGGRLQRGRALGRRWGKHADRPAGLRADALRLPRTYRPAGGAQGDLHPERARTRRPHSDADVVALRALAAVEDERAN